MSAPEITQEVELPQILFKGRAYPVRRLHLPPSSAMHLDGWGTVDISTVELEKALMGDDGELISDEARRIDDEIFYYVDVNKMALPDKELEAFLIRTVV